MKLSNKIPTIKNLDLILIDELCSWRIDKEDFISKTSFKADFHQLTYLLDNTMEKCSSENNNQHFNAIFWELPNSLSKEEDNSIYKKYLLKNWHHEHEEIVGAFQIDYNNNVDNVIVLQKAIESVPDYLQPEGLKYSYIRKIIYAIGAQPQPNNIQALEELAKSDDEKIKGLALHQIEKRKKFGRWEFKKTHG